MEQDNLLREAQKVRAIIQQREISVYDSPTNVESDDFFTVVQLEALLKKQLIGRTDLVGLAVRTRSRIAKTLVCEALGYQAPRSFKRVSPRLPHPLIDVYAQQSTNLQIGMKKLIRKDDTSFSFLMIKVSPMYESLLVQTLHTMTIRVLLPRNIKHHDAVKTTILCLYRLQIQRISLKHLSHLIRQY